MLPPKINCNYVASKYIKFAILPTLGRLCNKIFFKRSPTVFTYFMHGKWHIKKVAGATDSRRITVFVRGSFCKKFSVENLCEKLIDKYSKIFCTKEPNTFWIIVNLRVG